MAASRADLDSSTGFGIGGVRHVLEQYAGWAPLPGIRHHCAPHRAHVNSFSPACGLRIGPMIGCPLVQRR